MYSIRSARCSVPAAPATLGCSDTGIQKEIVMIPSRVEWPSIYFVEDNEDSLKPHPARVWFQIPKRVGRFVGPSGILSVVDAI